LGYSTCNDNVQGCDHDSRHICLSKFQGPYECQGEAVNHGYRGARIGFVPAIVPNAVERRQLVRSQVTSQEPSAKLWGGTQDTEPPNHSPQVCCQVHCFSHEDKIDQEAYSLLERLPSASLQCGIQKEILEPHSPNSNFMSVRPVLEALTLITTWMPFFLDHMVTHHGPDIPRKPPYKVTMVVHPDLCSCLIPATTHRAMPEPSSLRPRDLETSTCNIVRFVSAACHCMELTARAHSLKYQPKCQASHAYCPMAAVLNPQSTRECSEKWPKAYGSGFGS